MTHHDHSKKSILVVGLEVGTFRSIDALLSRSHFAVDRVKHGESGLALSGHVRFDLLIVRHPLPDMTTAEFVGVLRRRGWVSSQAQLLVLAEDDKLAELKGQVNDALSAVLSVSQPAAVLDEVAGRLLKVAPRQATRLLVKLRARLESGDVLLMCQTENLSAGGMLVRTDQSLPKGTPAGFQFSLPGDREPLLGEAEVVRHAVPDIEKLVGIGLKFLSFKGNDKSRLDAYLAAHPHKRSR
jgi:CheY-like chemotaxis protein